MAQAMLRVTMLIVMMVAILATVSVRNIIRLMVIMMGMLMVMVPVDGTCQYNGDDTDHDDGRDTGDGELLILVNMMVKMMVMLLSFVYS